MTETQRKLDLVRRVMDGLGLGAVRLRGVDWFAWATGGGSSAVLLAAEGGVAEVLVTPRAALVLTDEIEAERLREEEVPAALETWSGPWADPGRREALVREYAGGRPVASDRPVPGEWGLTPELYAARLALMPEELERYRKLGRDAAEAMTEALSAAKPEWTEHELAGEGARALWRRGIHPALTMAAAASRVARHRHPVSTATKLGDRAMLVYCARRHGLYANLTRWVYFRERTADERRADDAVAAVEAAALEAGRPGTPVARVYDRLVEAYAAQGFAGEHRKHHQGGTTGYLAREEVSTPASRGVIQVGTALAWNPTVPGAKIEDTVVTTARGDHEILTVDPKWPTFDHAGRRRPAPMVKP